MVQIAHIALFAGAALAAPQVQIEARWSRGGWNGWKQSTTTTADVATSTPAPVTSATPVATTSAAPAPAPVTTTAAPVVTTTAAPATPATGKRGVAYNTASFASMFTSSSKVDWAYNWGSGSGGLTGALEYVPLLWGTASMFTSGWSSNAQNAINSGSKYLMSFNEPDESSQSNLSPADAASAYMTYMQPFAGKAKLGSPAVTNGGGSMGLAWLSSFMAACTSCTIDFVPIHWYSNNAADFINHVEAAYAQTGKPIWITEFGLTGSTDAQVESFMTTVMAWMDSTDYVHRYSYFMAAEGSLINSAGTALSAIGSTYVS